MYQFVKEPTAWIDVEWNGLDEEGFAQTNQIRMKVVLVPVSDATKTEGSEEATVEFVKRVSRDWSSIQGPDGKHFPFTAENIEAMCEHVPGFNAGFVRSYFKAWAGQGKIREKNSNASRADGPAGGGRRRKAQASPSS